MYFLTIETKYNTICLIVKELEEAEDILKQPWVISYKCEYKVLDKTKYKRLVKEIDNNS